MLMIYFPYLEIIFRTIKYEAYSRVLNARDVKFRWVYNSKVAIFMIIKQWDSLRGVLDFVAQKTISFTDQIILYNYSFTGFRA